MEPCSERLSGNTPRTNRILECGIGTVIIGVREPPKFVKCKGIELLVENRGQGGIL